MITSSGDTITYVSEPLLHRSRRVLRSNMDMANNLQISLLPSGRNYSKFNGIRKISAFFPRNSSAAKISFTTKIATEKQNTTFVNCCSNTATTGLEEPGKFGRFGGKYVPELLISCLSDLEAEFNSVLHDPQFQEELAISLRDYVGRETPLYFAHRLTEHYKDNNGCGPEIYLKREDLNHGGAHKINNAIAQAMLAKRLGKSTVVAATGAGQHGVATAAACAKFGLQCIIVMGVGDMERQSSNVYLMRLLGAQVKSVDGNFKDSSSEAIRQWVSELRTSYYLPGTVVGPHPCPSMVREFQSVIGKETRRQALERWGGKPDVLVACIGSGSNALGLFHEFTEDEDVRMIGVEAAGFGLESGRHSATLAKGEVGVYHGAMSYLLQDDEGQILGAHSIGVGLEYPGVGPQLSYLKETMRAEFYAVTDQEALDAYKRLCKLEGIFPALEACHALAFLEKLCPTLRDGSRVVVNISGRGDKDALTVYQYSLIAMEANLKGLQKTNIKYL